MKRILMFLCAVVILLTISAGSANAQCCTNNDCLRGSGWLWVMSHMGSCSFTDAFKSCVAFADCNRCNMLDDWNCSSYNVCRRDTCNSGYALCKRCIVPGMYYNRAGTCCQFS